MTACESSFNREASRAQDTHRRLVGNDAVLNHFAGSRQSIPVSEACARVSDPIPHSFRLMECAVSILPIDDLTPFPPTLESIAPPMWSALGRWNPSLVSRSKSVNPTTPPPTLSTDFRSNRLASTSRIFRPVEASYFSPPSATPLGPVKSSAFTLRE